MKMNVHFVVNEKYLKDEKVYSVVLYWVIPKEFEDPEDNDNICTGFKEIHIYHKIKAGYYVSSDCKSCKCGVDVPTPCCDEIIGFVKRLYPDCVLFGNKEALKNYLRRKKCVDVEER